MNRRSFLRQLGAGAVAIGAAPLSCSEIGPRPNVVLINVDDLGWRDVGCFGARYYDTPNIDALCAQGLKFTDAYASAAVCSPTRAAIMTGRYPARTGVTDWIRPPAPSEHKLVQLDGTTKYIDDPSYALLCPRPRSNMPRCEVTLAEILGERGYATAHVGKWHLGTHYPPDEQGFDHNLGGNWYGQIPTYFDPYERGGLGAPPGLPPREVGEYLTDREAAEAVRFIRENRDRPFFLNLWHYGVHHPLEAKPEVIQKYEDKQMPARHKPVYGAMVEIVDQSVGAVMGVLDELGLFDSTLVIFTSDNGGRHRISDNRPLRAGKGHPYEGGIRIPQILRLPGLGQAGQSTGVPVTSVDLLPTICEATGSPLPDGVPIDGASLLPLLRGEQSAWSRSAIFWHYPHVWNAVPPYSIIRKGSWKLIQRYAPGRFPLRELYDLTIDISESTDLATSEATRADALQAELDAWIEEVGGKLPRPRPA